jgi:hypothetical protein
MLKLWCACTVLTVRTATSIAPRIQAVFFIVVSPSIT